jgi:endonuclease III
MNSEDVNQIFQIFSDLNPKPKTELEYTNNFTLAVAVILSAQATDISVNKATKNLFSKYDTPEQIYSLGEDNLKTYIKTIGLYNSKAKNIISFAKILIEQYNSQLPESFEELVKLPGIGQKTANVILNCAFGVPTIAVDTHLFRLAHRLGLSNGKTPEKVEADLMRIIPNTWLQHAHHWLILHGRYICKAKKPSCNICPISKYCPSNQSKNLAINILSNVF